MSSTASLAVTTPAGGDAIQAASPPPAFLVAPPAAAAAAPTRAQARFEVRFMENMIDHHLMAVEMAELCETRAVHQELRDLCANIKETQTAEIAQMQSWLQQWYGVSYQPQMKPGMERQLEELASLGGAEFEVAFMQMMIEHHETAVREGEKCVDRAFHPQLIELCHNIVQTQTQEIQQMQTWLHDWYGISMPGAQDPQPHRHLDAAFGQFAVAEPGAAL